MQLEGLLRKKSINVLDKNQKLYLSLQHVFKELSNYPYAVIKGEALSILAYGEAGYRASHDVDLLTCKTTLPHICRVLYNNGFTQRIPSRGGWRELTRMEEAMYANSHEIPPFRKFEKSIGEIIEIDVNFNVIWGESWEKSFDIEDWLHRCIDMWVYGVRIRSLAADDAFVQMCLHHYREMNSIYTMRLKNPISVAMFQDIYMFYVTNYQTRPEYLRRLAEHYHIMPYLYYLLYYVSLIFKDESLWGQLCKFYCKEGENLLDSYGLSKREKKKWKVDFFTRLNHPDIFRLIENDLTANDFEKIDRILTVYEDKLD